MKIGFGPAPKGVVIGTPSTATVMIEEPDMPEVAMSLSPGTISENGGVSTISAWLGYATEYDVTVTVRVETGDRSSPDDFTLSENRTLTIAAGSKWSTGTVTVTAVDDAVLNPDKVVWVRGSVTGLPGVTEASARSLYIEDDDPLGVTLKLSPDSISEDGGVSTVTATLNGTASDDVTVTVAAAAVAPAVANDFALTGTTLTIAAGQTSSTGTVTITANDNDVHGAAKSVTVTGTLTGSTDVSAPAARTLTITDNETLPAVTLALDPASISENGGESTVTATLSAATSEDVTLAVSATAVSPAVAGDFELSGNTELTIAAGQTESTGTVTIAAEDNDVDAPAKEVTVAAAVTAGPSDLVAPASQTLTITDDEEVPTLTLVLGPTSISEDAGVSTVTATLSHASSEEIRLAVSATPVDPAVAGDFERSATPVLTIAAGQTESTGTVTITAEDNDADAPAKDLTNRGGGDRRAYRAGRAGIADPDDHGRRRGPDGDPDSLTGRDFGGSGREHGDGATEPRDERGGPSDGLGGRSVTGGGGGLRAERSAGADDHGGADAEHGDSDGGRGRRRRRHARQAGHHLGERRRTGGDLRAGNGHADDYRRRSGADGDPGADAGIHLRERRREHGDRAAEPCDERGGPGDGVGGGGAAGGCGGFRVERESGADHRGGADGEHRHGDRDRQGQHHRCAHQAGDGLGGGERARGVVRPRGEDAGDNGRRRDTDRDAGPHAGRGFGERRGEHGDGAARRRDERAGDGHRDGPGRSGGVPAECEPRADDRRGTDAEHGRSDDHGRRRHRRRRRRRGR